MISWPCPFCNQLVQMKTIDKGFKVTKHLVEDQFGKLCEASDLEFEDKEILNECI